MQKTTKGASLQIKQLLVNADYTLAQAPYILTVAQFIVRRF